MNDLRIPDSLLPADGRFGSGPSRVRPEQLAALQRAGQTVIGTSHRQAPVRSLVRSVRAGIAALLGAPDGYEVVLGNGGSTAFWDVAAFSLIERRSQHLSHGEFGAKFAKAAAAPWLQAPAVITAPAGSRGESSAQSDVDAYAWPQNETSTGVVAPVRRVAHDGALMLVDATSAAGGVEVDLAQTDAYYFAPQKNLGSDGGLWVAVLSPAALERTARIAASGRYIPEFLSLQQAVVNSRLDQTLNTPAVATLVLLDEQVRWINEQGGLSWATARTARSSALVYDWAGQGQHTAPFVQRSEDRSPVVVTVDFDDRIDATAVTSILRRNGIVDVEPYRKLGRNQIRVGTFVSVEPDDVQALLASIDHVIEHADVRTDAGDARSGSTEAAAAAR